MGTRHARLALLLVVSILPLAIAQTKMPPAANKKVDYKQDIQPILQQKCYSCHGREVQQVGLRLDLRQNALRGGDYGPVIRIGDSANSKFIRRLVDGDGGMQMPPGEPLSAEEIGLLRAWIDQGVEFRTDIIDEKPPAPVDPKIVSFIDLIRAGKTAEVRKQLAKDPDLVKGKLADGSTALHHAAAFGPLATVELLVSGGADVNARNRRGSTPLHWSVASEEKLKYLISKGANVNARQVDGRTPVYMAALLGNGAGSLRALLASGADPNISTSNGTPPLMAASARGGVAAMSLLIEKGAKVNVMNGSGETPLMSAASSGSTEAVKLLLDKGADVKVKSKRTETALGFAATSANQTIVEMLLDRGADVNVRNFRGFSPLMFAASSDMAPAGIIRMLLAKGADQSFTADYDENAADLALKRGYTEVAKLLGAKPPTPPVATARKISYTSSSIPDVVSRSMGLLSRQSSAFIRISGCNSCHSQDLPSAAFGLAREMGLVKTGEYPQLPRRMQTPPDQKMDLTVVGPTSEAWELFNAGMNRKPADSFTDATARYILITQGADGGWSNAEGRRPPMNSGRFQSAALAIYSLKHYAPQSEIAASERAVMNAVKWLEASSPVTNQDHAFRLMGFGWGGASDQAIRSEVRAIKALQRPDGGWSQLPNMQSDAYATGEILFALASAGKLRMQDPVFRRGVDFLMNSVAPDGSWHVKTRAIWLQPFLESGFPHGQDQFISTAGTAWATMALIMASDSDKQTRR